jgi:pimeloyl-ACP methyl ester carboxylesterase
VLDNEGVDSAVVAGHSMGGYVAMEMAYKYPEAIKGLMMIHSIASADTEEKKEQRRKAIALIGKGGKEAFVKQMIPTLFSHVTVETHPDIVANQLAEALKTPAQSLIAFYNAMINRQNRVEVLPTATFPVFWAIGNADNLIPKEKIMQQSMLSSVNFVELYKDSGHMAMLEEPEQLTVDMIEFSSYCHAS